MRVLVKSSCTQSSSNTRFLTDIFALMAQVVAASEAAKEQAANCLHTSPTIAGETRVSL
jgi:hypothetical protein